MFAQFLLFMCVIYTFLTSEEEAAEAAKAAAEEVKLAAAEAKQEEPLHNLSTWANSRGYNRGFCGKAGMDATSL
jgi:hypothetical protein